MQSLCEPKTTHENNLKTKTESAKKTKAREFFTLALTKNI